MKAKVKVDLYWIQKNTELGIVVCVCTPTTRGSKVPGQSGLYSKTVSKTDGPRGMDGWMDNIIWGSTTAPQRAHLRSLEHLSKGSLRYLTRKQNGCERYLTECVLLLTSLQGEMVR